MNKLQHNDEYAISFIQMCREISHTRTFIYKDVEKILPSSNALLKMRGNGWINRIKQGAGPRPTEYQISKVAHEAAMAKATDEHYKFEVPTQDDRCGFA